MAGWQEDALKTAVKNWNDAGRPPDGPVKASMVTAYAKYEQSMQAAKQNPHPLDYYT